ncbi:MAG: hypothetical protein ACRC33_05190, partial [Gemmataceae bacterium]
AAAATAAEGGDPTGTGSASPNGIPLGVMGDATSLHLFSTKVPVEAHKGQLVSDIRRISYWIGSEGGLCRAEVKVILTQDATTIGIPAGDEEGYKIAPEVVAAEFQYFDGTGWQDSWDSSLAGPDGSTPLGPPRAIAVRLTIQPPPVDGAEPPTKTYRHVVVIPTANGQSQTPGGG